MDDTWGARDLPVLAALVEHFDDPDAIPWRLPDVESATGLDAGEVVRALAALDHAEPPYLESISHEELAYPTILTGITERARREVGAWPTPEALVDRLVAALSEAADSESDPEQKSKLRQAAQWLGGALRDVTTQVVAGAVLRLGGL
jgi:hypothetical protein